MRTALIGPVFPFRGGVAHYTALLYGHLADFHEARLYTFSRKYPSMFYPGNSAPDQSRMRLHVANALRIIDWLNPFSWLKAGVLIARWSPDAAIFTWWMWGWAIPTWVIAKIVSLRKNTKRIFICHNIIEHESARWKYLLARFALSCTDCYIVHSKVDYMNLKAMFPNAKAHICFHPTYEVFRQDLMSKKEARAALNIKPSVRKVILFFGVIRPYKGLQYLIEAMGAIIQELSDIRLLVVGEFWEGAEMYRRQIKALQLNDAIKIVDKYVPNEDIGKYFTAADVVVLPYVNGTGSGVVQIAYGFDRPVIATTVGSLSDVVLDGITGCLVKPRSSEEIANAVVSFYKHKMERKMVHNIKLDKEKFSWSRMINTIESVIEAT